jgi:phage tail-like protein
MSGQFTNVSGIGMEFEYETYNEGGSNYPRYFFKNAVPQTLVLQQGTVTTIDAFAAWMNTVNLGVSAFLNGVVALKDHTGMIRRNWTIQGAFPVKYIGPELNSLHSSLAVSRIELQYNGCI